MAQNDSYEKAGELNQTERLVVKWFNPAKGYGFLVPEDAEEDIFLHFSVLDQAGYYFLSPGDIVICEVGFGKQGRQVMHIHEVYPSHLDAKRSQDDIEQVNWDPSEPLEDALGQVKWFNTFKGFGFVKPDDGGRDVFIHASVLKRIGMQKIFPGQRVRMRVCNSDRGRQAWSLEIAS